MSLYTGIAAAEEVRYGVGSWPPELGNHRARIHVPEPADAVWVHIPWRRRDPSPQDKPVVVLEATSGKAVNDLVRVNVNREFGDLVFRPETAPAEYHVYYMPYTASTIPHAYAIQYAAPRATANPAFLKRHDLTPEGIAQGRWKALPRASVLEMQARSEFDRFDPMEVIATAEETEELLRQYPKQTYLLFPEDREHPIRMTDDLPQRWIRNRPSAEFRGRAQRGEFFVFQIGVYAARESIEDLTIRFGDLRSERGKVIAAKACRCFNLGGTDWLARPMTKKFAVARGKVGALWFGVDIPKDADPGTYRASLTFQPSPGAESAVRLSLSVSADAIEDAGDSQLARLSRLRWLDSTIGLDDEAVAPYTPLRVHNNSVECLGRQVQFANTGLPDSIRSGGRDILAKPIVMVVKIGAREVPWTQGRLTILKTTPGAVVLQSERTGGPLTMQCRAGMECDGYINFRVTLRAQSAIEVDDICLEIPIRRQVAAYMMGMGRKGGHRPTHWRWTWDINRANNSLWIGDVDAGLHCKLKGPDDTWDLYNLRASGIPAAWGNGGKGGCTVSEEAQDTVLIRAYSGPRVLEADEELRFCFGLLITPVKPLDAAHWKQRYYHAYVPVDTAVRAGATIINIHHGNELNPHINYPFLAADRLAAYAREAHDKGLKVKIYYTVRELSNYVAEMWPLRSLGYEVFRNGPGGGHSWLHEHLVSHYAPAWHHTFGNGMVDAAIATTGLSRWHNYYLEGLRWLLKNAEIDGLYLDGIGYDREIMKRVRKVMDRTRPGCLIDFHSGNNFHPEYGLSNCATQYMEHFPYVNSLWFGEGFDYEESPDYWLVEISGIPFGLFGEMLQGNGNPWRGMIYGMTARYYSGADPKHIWKLWDDFGIQDAKMVGYWVESCPVRPDHSDVLATAYCKRDKVLVSLASWAKEPVQCGLRIDWRAVGLNPQKANLLAPGVAGFQPAASFAPSDLIPIEPGRGWLLIISEESHEQDRER